MNDASKRTLARRFEWISYHLERQAYQAQMKGRTAGLKQFTPCNKALVFTKNMYSDNPSTVVIHDASITPCQCHRGLSELDIDNLYQQATQEIPHES